MFTILFAHIERLRKVTRVSYWRPCAIASFVAFTAYCWLRAFLPDSEDELTLFVVLQAMGLALAVFSVAEWNRGVASEPPLTFDLGARETQWVRRPVKLRLVHSKEYSVAIREDEQA